MGQILCKSIHEIRSYRANKLCDGRTDNKVVHVRMSKIFTKIVAWVLKHVLQQSLFSEFILHGCTDLWRKLVDVISCCSPRLRSAPGTDNNRNLLAPRLKS